jgi:hypothetical protein
MFRTGKPVPGLERKALYRCGPNFFKQHTGPVAQATIRGLTHDR